MFTLALKKEGVGLQPEPVQALFVNRSIGQYGAAASEAFGDDDHKDFLIDYEAERYTSRHLQIYLSM